MKTIEGRQWARREDLIEHSGYSRATLENLWRDREANGHPPARKIDRVMHWDLEEWTSWFEQHRQRQDQGRAERSRQPQLHAKGAVDRSGDPDEELPPAEQARVLGIDVSRISQYAKNPPAGWPAPVRVERLEVRTREYRTRRQLWTFVDENPDFGSPYPRGEPGRGRPRDEAKAARRLRQAIAAIKAQPDRKHAELAEKLAARHEGSPDVWRRVLTEARKARPDLVDRHEAKAARRLRQAIAAMETHPDLKPFELAEKLAARHGNSPKLWTYAITEARKARPDLVTYRPVRDAD